MQKKKLIFAAMIGNALEYYDFTLYGFFAAYLSPLYFPSDNHTTSLITSFGAFAAGFFMRPVGSLIFGHLGDKHGRKKALFFSVFLITLPTLIIGILPTYSQIGVLAPLMIVICRLAQGICTAGEYTGATVLISEYTERNQPGFACSLLPASSLMGAIIGTGLGALFLMEGMPSWAWRIPFVMGFIFGLFGLYLRSGLKESPLFTHLEKKKLTVGLPILDVLKYQKRNFLCTMGMGATSLASFYMISVYVFTLTAQLKLPPSYGMLLNIFPLFCWITFLPIIGYFSDKVGLRKMMNYGAVALIVLSVPVFSFVSQEISVGKILFAQVVLSLCGALFVAPMGAFLATKLFPVSSRYSGIALGISCGEALFGGTAPLIATALVVLTGATTAPGFYLMFCSVIGWLALRYSKPISSSVQKKDGEKESVMAKKQWAV
jgi:MHS family proline/betaine transporter-like MFS transporter